MTPNLHPSAAGRPRKSPAAQILTSGRKSSLSQSSRRNQSCCELPLGNSGQRNVRFRSNLPTSPSWLEKKAALLPVDFDQYSKSCWSTINNKYVRMKSSEQSIGMGHIPEELSDSREAIMKQAGPDTRFETRRNVIEVLRKICKSVMLSDEQQIRHELMKDGMLLEEFAKGMTEEERQKYKDEGLYEKLVDLQNECDEVGIERLADIYALFDGEERNGEDDGSDDDSEGGEVAGRNASFESSSSGTIPPPTPSRTKVFSIGELS